LTTSPQRKPRVLAAKQPKKPVEVKSEAAAKPKTATTKAKPTTTKSKSKTATKATKPKPAAKSGGPRPYEGSFAQKCDIETMKGGTIEDIAKAAGTTPGVIRGHIKYRTRNGKYKLEETGDQVRLVLVEG
jgi:hypothetical protein